MLNNKYSDPEFEEQAWLHMKSKLDQEMPNKKSRGNLFWIGFVLLGLSMVGWFLYDSSQDIDQEGRASSTSVHIADTDDPSQSNNAIQTQSELDDQNDQLVDVENRPPSMDGFEVESSNSMDDNGSQVTSVYAESYEKDIRANMTPGSEYGSSQQKLDPVDHGQVLKQNVQELDDLTSPDDLILVLSEENTQIEWTESDHTENPIETRQIPRLGNSDIVKRDKLIINRNNLPRLKWTPLVQTNTLTIKSILLTPEDDKTLVTVHQNRRDRNTKYGLFAMAQTSIHSFAPEYNVGAFASWKASDRFGFTAHMDYSQLTMKDEVVSTVFLEDVSSMDTQIPVPHTNSSQAKLKTVGIGLDLDWFVDDRLYFALGATYRINTEGKSQIQGTEQIVLPSSSANLDQYAHLDTGLNEYSLESIFGNTLAVHVDLTYRLTSRWSINAGVENYFSDWRSPSAQDGSTTLNASGNMSSSGLLRNNIIATRTGLRYTF